VGKGFRERGNLRKVGSTLNTVEIAAADFAGTFILEIL
jgi:hypothetical protein